jgi:methyl-accepting chemotaxis protein
MLAVNGSVEAARAGASGKGFAVVSNDIRGLARESASNVERAKNTVRAILDQIATLKRDLEQIIAISEVEGDNNAEVVVHLQRLGEDIEKLAASNRAIVDRADDIMTGSAEASGGARQIATAAEEASAASRQAAAAANEQTRGAEDLAAAIEEIASLADAQRSE